MQKRAIRFPVRSTSRPEERSPSISNKLVCDADRSHFPANVRAVIISLETIDCQRYIGRAVGFKRRKLLRHSQNTLFFNDSVELVHNRNVYLQPVDRLLTLVTDAALDVHRNGAEG